MKQKMKRYLGIVFSLVLVLGIIPCMGLTAFAQDEFTVTINAGANMTKTDGSGAETQTGLTGAMTDVVYTADEGYYFPTDYSVASVNDISVTRDSYTQITVSGTPTADTEITLTAPTQKTKPDAPTTVEAVDCTTSANNDGKLTGVTSAMDYKKSDADNWSDGNDEDITELVPGTYYVRVKATDTTLASDNLTVEIKATYEVIYKVVNGTWSDDTNADKTENVQSGSQPASVPTGMKAASGYTGGAWDTDPANTTITEAKTFTYTFTAVKPNPQPSGSGKTNPTVTAPTAKDLTYTGQAQELVNAGKADGGTMEYALGTDDKTAPTTGWSTTVPSGKDAGNYFVWYRVKGDASHNDVAAKCVPATIAADKEVADVISKIDALPEKDKVQESDKAAIEAARAAYDALTDEEKAQVPADELKKLTDAEEALKAFEPEQPTVYMRAHVENRGWDAKTTPIGPGTSDTIGTTGQSLRMEALDMVVPENYKVTGFAHIQNYGDTDVIHVNNPDYQVPEGYTVYRFGTTGRALRMEAIEIHLLDENGKPVEGFQYASHLQDIGWEGYVNNGSFTGTRHQSRRLEALRFAYPEADAADAQQ